MAEPKKAASSITDSKMKSPLFEDDNELDFLGSWKSTAGGKDVLDFSTEAIPCERNKVFDFDKLKDFELDAEFGKMSSFKMDMSDLDFSSPQKKTEKTKERPGKEATSAKLQGKKDQFSFSFDFNELDAFDLDTDLLKGEKKPKKCAENDVLDLVAKDVQNLPKLGSTNGSNSKDLVNSRVELDAKNSSTCISPADLKHCDTCHEEPTTQEKQITTSQASKDETNCTEDKRDLHDDHALTMASKKTNAENFVQDISVQSDDFSSKEQLQHFQKSGSSSATVDANSGQEKDNSCKTEDCYQSESNSPVKAYDSKCIAALCTEESLGTEHEPERNLVDQRNVAQDSVIFHEPLTVEKDIKNNSVGPVLHKALPQMRSNKDKQRLSSNVLLSSLHRDSKHDKFIAMKENISGLQLLPGNKSQATGSSLASTATPQQIYAICNKKMEVMNLHPANGKSGDGDQGGTYSGSFNRTLKVGSVSAQSNTTSQSIQRPASSTETMSKTKAPSVVKYGNSLPNSDRGCDLSYKNISRIAKSKYLSNSVMKETKSASQPKRDTIQQLKASPAAANCVTMEKCAVLSPPLKRKSAEVSLVEQLTLSSPKRILESPSESRTSLQISPTICGQVGLENETIGSDIYLDHPQPLIDIHVEGRFMDIEDPISLENDGIIEKAEACTKELEKMCNMLKKKHEEAKELLVRAIINNNSLLMLDHPMYEEKILAFQRFAAALLLKKYDT